MTDIEANNSDPDHSNDDVMDRFSTLIAKNLDHDLSEEILLSKLEEIFSPSPAKLFSSDEERDALQKRTDQLARRFSRNGPIIILPHDADPATGKVRIDDYYGSLTDEWFIYFYKCRRSICRTHMYFITHGSLTERPEFWPSMPDDIRTQAAKLIKARFWNSLEVATTRMVSY